MTFVFVYGSLKKGFHNHHVLHSSECITGHAISDCAYSMVSLGGFPGVIKSLTNQGFILGEVYKVSDKTLASLDRLEGNKSFYEREEVGWSHDIRHMSFLTAWMYFLIHPPSVPKYVRPNRDNIICWSNNSDQTIASLDK